MSESDDWQSRLKDEYTELNERIGRLDDFIYSERVVDDEAVRAQLGLMYAQLHVMCAYRSILNERAKAAGVELLGEVLI